MAGDDMPAVVFPCVGVVDVIDDVAVFVPPLILLAQSIAEVSQAKLDLAITNGQNFTSAQRMVQDRIRPSCVNYSISTSSLDLLAHVITLSELEEISGFSTFAA